MSDRLETGDDHGGKSQEPSWNTLAHYWLQRNLPLLASAIVIITAVIGLIGFIMGLQLSNLKLEIKDEVNETSGEILEKVGDNNLKLGVLEALSGRIEEDIDQIEQRLSEYPSPDSFEKRDILFPTSQVETSE